MTYLNVETGQRDAKYLAKLNREKFKLVNKFFGSFVDKYLGEAPRVLPLAHVLRCNSDFANPPGGYLRASITNAQEVGKTADDLLSPSTCTYVWMHALNRDSFFLYTKYPTIFTAYNEDFWRCAYLLNQLDYPAFTKIWVDSGVTSNDAGAAYTKVAEYVANARGTIITWSVRALKTFVLYECEFTFQLAKYQGSLTSTGPGKAPTETMEY